MAPQITPDTALKWADNGLSTDKNPIIIPANRLNGTSTSNRFSPLPSTNTSNPPSAAKTHTPTRSIPHDNIPYKADTPHPGGGHTLDTTPNPPGLRPGGKPLANRPKPVSIQDIPQPHPPEAATYPAYHHILIPNQTPKPTIETIP